MNIYRVGAELFHVDRQRERQTQGQTLMGAERQKSMTKLRVVSRNVVNALKTGNITGILLNTVICLTADFMLCSKLKKMRAVFPVVQSPQFTHLNRN
jgi:hypothetical protein